MDTNYQGADFWSDMRHKNSSLWNILIEPMVEDKGRVYEFNEAKIQCKEMRKLYLK
jgi:hypothetical protein